MISTRLPTIGRALLVIASSAAQPLLAQDTHEQHCSEAARTSQRQDAMEPGNEAARFTFAQELLRRDEPAAALACFSALAERRPGNVDYVFGRSQSLARLDRPREALDALQHATARAPDYEALWRLRFSLLKANPSLMSTDKLQALRNEAQAHFPDARWWRSGAAADEWRGQVTLAAFRENLSGDLPGWHSESLRVDWDATANLQLLAAVSRNERFNRLDRTYLAGMRRQLPDKWHAGLEYEATPNAKFLPENGFAAFAGRRLGHGWVAEVRARRRNYDTATVTVWSLQAERYFSDYRAAYTMHVARLHGLANSVSHVMTLNWYRTQNSSFGVTIAYGDETEAVGLGQVLETSVSSLTINGQHALNRRFTLNWWLGTHEQGDFYRRRYAGMAVTAGF